MGSATPARHRAVGLRLAGPTLSQWLGAEERSWREILAVFRQAGRGLGAAHRAGLVHGDFKPANVMFGRDGRVRVVDFGLARPAPAAGRPGVAQPAGTPGYVAPELLRGRPPHAGSGQYAFCVALWQALCGAPPGAGPTNGAAS